MNKTYDAIVVGGGPAGLSAAIYLARAKFSVLVIEKDHFGGQITITSEVVNYPGHVKTSGKELTENMRIQAQNFGAEFLLAEVKNIKLKDDIKTIITDKGTFKSVGVVLATGCHPRKLGFPGEKEYQGHGVAYCATCDGEFFTDKDVFVIGGGFAAAEEAVFLTKYAKKVTIIVREEDFLCAKSVADKAKNHEKIEVFYNTEIIEAKGDHLLREATFINNKTQEKWTYQTNDTFGIFVFAGYQPESSLFEEQLELNETKNLIVDSNQKTNIDGVYGAGDICVKQLRQVVTAVSDGATAATSLEKYIPQVVEKLNIKTLDNKPKEVIKEDIKEDNEFINDSMKQQLLPIFEKFIKPLVIYVEDDQSRLSQEMIGFLDEFTQLTDKITYIIKEGNIASMKFYDENHNYLGVTYHAVPGGHEFNSFIIALYNAIGPKQAIDEQLLNQIHSIDKKTKLSVVVSLSCTMCPELVMATQRIALENKYVEAEMFDLAHFTDLKDKYQIMSVPCLIINDKDVYFGKKDISQLLEIINKSI